MAVLFAKHPAEIIGVLILKEILKMLNLTILMYSLIYGIDPTLSFQMARVESNMNPKAFSNTKDGGLFQLNSNYYKFHNTSWIFNTETNTALAMKRLSILKNECSHKMNNYYLLCYNMGIKGAKKIKHPKNQSYIKKMNLLWR